MPGNIEVKARLADIEEALQRALLISDEHIKLEQSDTFFDTPKECRLKLRHEKDRDTNAETACLVAYQRPDVVGPKFSKYVLSAVPDPASLEAALAMSNGILGKVEKQRDVFIASRKNLKARIHIDVVKHLGTYMEFEVIVEQESQLDEAKDFATYLSDYFRLSESDHIPGAYWNLLQSKTLLNGK